MPFGTVYAALILVLFGVDRAMRLIGSGEPPARALGASTGILAIALALGLLARKGWARWAGAAACALLAASAAASFDLLPMLAGATATILLVVPATGRPAAPVASPARTTWGRTLLGAACLSLVGCLAATAWAVARAPFGTREQAVRPDAGPGAAPARAAWVDFSSGLAAARSSKKLMLVDFYATWCNPCKIMEKRTLSDPRVEQRLRDVVTVRVDSEEEVERGGLKGIDLATRYAVESYPTIVVIDGEGREVARSVGVLGAEEFLSWLDAVLERASTSVARS